MLKNKSTIKNLLLTSTVLASIAISQPAYSLSTSEFFDAARSGDLSGVGSMVEEIKAQLSKSPQYQGYQVNLDFKDSAGNTPLIEAAEAGHLDVVRYLVENGADPRMSNGRNETALKLAKRFEHSDVVDFLEDGDDAAALLRSSKSYSAGATNQGQAYGSYNGTASFSSPRAATDGVTGFASSSNAPRTAAYGYSNNRGSDKASAQNSFSTDDFFAASSSGDIRRVESLVNSVNAEIQRSSQYSNHAINLDFTNNLGNTPLMEAAASGHVDVVDYLIKNGANPNLTNNRNRTAIILASNNGEKNVVNYLQNSPTSPAPTSSFQKNTGTTQGVTPSSASDGIFGGFFSGGSSPSEDGLVSNSDLMKAAMAGDAQKVSSMIANLQNKISQSSSQGDALNLDFTNSKGSTPLMEAAERGHNDVVAILIKNGANPNLTNNNGQTAFTLAQANGQTQVVSQLLGNGNGSGAKFAAGFENNNSGNGGSNNRGGAAFGTNNDRSALSNNGSSAASAAPSGNNEGLFGGLFSGNSNPSKYGIVSNNDLMRAAMVGDAQKVSGMIASLQNKISQSPSYQDKALNLDFTNSKGNTPLMEAAERGHNDVVAILIKNGANPNLTNNNGQTAFTLAQANGQNQVASQLLGNSGGTGSNNRGGSFSSNRGGAIPNPSNNTGYGGSTGSALSPESYSTQDLFAASANGDYNKVTAIVTSIKTGIANSPQYSGYVANLDFKNAAGNTPLMEAAANGHTDIVKFLISNGANPNAVNNNGMTAIAIAKNSEYPQIASILTNPNAYAGSGVGTNSITSPTSPSTSGGYSTSRTPAVAMTFSPDKLFVASATGNAPQTEALINGLKVQTAQSSPYTNAGINLDFLNSNGDTPLMVAASNGHTDIVDMLIKNGANPNITNNNGQTAFTLAQSNGHNQVVNLLLGNPVNPQGTAIAYGGGSGTGVGNGVGGAYGGSGAGTGSTAGGGTATGGGIWTSSTALTIGGLAVIGGAAAAIGGGGGSSGDSGSTPALDLSGIDDPKSGTPATFLTAETATNEGIANQNTQFAWGKGYDGREYERDANGVLLDTNEDDTITVTVFDSGVDLDHPELDDNILAADGLTCRAGACVAGGDDTEGHGTAVAGVIAAERNGVGTAGVAPKTKIIPIDFLDPDDLAAALDATSAKDSKIYNWSFGFTNLDGDMIPIATTTKGNNVAAAITQTTLNNFLAIGNGATDLGTEIQQAVAADKIIVVAAGNEGADQSDFLGGLPRYFDGTTNTANPSGFDWSNNWVNVVSLNDGNTISTFSNECGVTKDYCLAAPGEIANTTALGGGLSPINGTSFSAPIVSGAIAIMVGAYPHLDSEDIINILFETATDLGAAGTDDIYGRGLINLQAATTPTDGEWAIALSSTIDGSSASFSRSGLNLSPAFGDAIAKNDKNFIFLDGFKKDYSVSLSSIVGTTAIRKSSDEIYTDFAEPTFAQEARMGDRSKMSFTLQDQDEGFLRKSLSEYSEDDDNMFALQYGMTYGDNKINTMMNYNVNAGDVIGFKSTAATQEGNLLASDAFKNPYLTMVDHSKGTGTELELDKLSLKLMLFDGETEKEKFEFADSNRIRGFVTEASYNESESFGISLQTGMNIEEETFLGSESGGALQLNGETRTFHTGLATRYSPAKDFYLNANYNVGITQLNESDNSLINGVSDIYTDSFAVGAELHNLYNNSDRIGFSISQPLRVRSANANLSLPQDVLAGGSVVFDSSSLSLAPEGRQIDLEAFYDVNFQDNSSLSIGSIHKIDADHIEDAEDESLFLLKYKTKF